MKRKITALIAGALLSIVSMNGAFAQGSPAFRVVPADLWACSFNDRQDMGDLDGWVDRFNQWADDQEDNSYVAWTLTNSYFGPTQAEWDFIWLGAWTDGNAMGEGWDLWNETNNGLMAEFLGIANCQIHANFASVAYRLFEDRSTPDGGVIVFQDCVRHDGVTNSAVGNAARQWVNVLDENDITSALYMWYPAFGGGPADFDYKQVSAYRNYSDLGDFYEKYTNGRLFQQYNALFEHLADCDVARVYNVQTRRYVDVRAGQ